MKIIPISQQFRLENEKIVTMHSGQILGDKNTNIIIINNNLSKLSYGAVCYTGNMFTNPNRKLAKSYLVTLSYSVQHYTTCLVSGNSKTKKNYYLRYLT